jgi:hypothetical protein
MQHSTRITLHDLYPRFTKSELEEAEANLERFLAVVARIVERLRIEGQDPSRGGFDGFGHGS